jgi:zinc protease
MVEIEREIGDYASTRPATDEEVATAKRRNTLSLPGRWETARSVARDIQDIVRFGLPDDYWDSYAERVQALDTASVDEIARDLLTPGDLTWLVVGDLEQIESSIRELDIGEVTVIDTAGRIIN